MLKEPLYHGAHTQVHYDRSGLQMSCQAHLAEDALVSFTDSPWAERTMHNPHG